ncbi:MAG: hypothetical protein M1380_03890, partial [Chloroflexi bacterium]|nr:hypothetical protein [Chloroflexota bacterium]
MAGASDLQQGHPIALKLDQVGGTAGLAGTLPLGETDRATAAGVSRVTYALGMFAGPASTRVQ